MKNFNLFIFLIILGCSQQKNDCSKFKTGTFKYLDQGLNHIIITRSDSIQVEYNNKDNVTITTSIEWTSSCEYILTYKNVTNDPYVEDILGKKIHVTILSMNGNTYVGRVSSSTTKLKTRMIKIK